MESVQRQASNMHTTVSLLFIELSQNIKLIKEKSL